VRRSRLTRSGTAVAVGVVLAAVCGVVTGYHELLVLAGVGVVLLAIALVLPRASADPVLHRHVARSLLPVGDAVECMLRLEAPRGAAPMTIVDRVVGVEVPMSVPALAAGRALELRYHVRALRRGVHELGPVAEERHDLFDLAVRSLTHDVPGTVWVHPVVHDLGPADHVARMLLPYTTYRSISDDPLAEFRTLREYSPGDDPRLIHWTTSARLGRLVVKDFLELRRSSRLVVLETADAALTDAELEEAAEIAASLAAQGLVENLVTSVRTTDRHAPGDLAPLHERTELLKLLAAVRRTSAEDTLSASRTVNPKVAPDEIVLVTGSGRSGVLAHLLGGVRARPRLVLVRVSARPAALPRLSIPTLDVRSAQEFVRRWRVGEAA
jgi:uncharacterized protein (DUF58 family)